MHGIFVNTLGKKFNPKSKILKYYQNGITLYLENKDKEKSHALSK